jgi:2-haloacid dehalogenase
MLLVVFDIGNVLLRWNPRYLYSKLFSDPLKMEWFLENVCDAPWNEAQDKGRLWADAVAERIALYPEWEAHIRAYDERWLETLDGEITENVHVLRELKQFGIPLYAITNFSSEKLTLAKARFDFFVLFDGIVVSGEEHLIKPDPRLFGVLFNRYALTPRECVFIDDSCANVEAAAQLGMRTIHYAENVDLCTALRGHGFALASADQQ